MATNCYAAANAFTLAGVVYLTKWVWNFGFVWGPLILYSYGFGCVPVGRGACLTNSVADRWGHFGSRVARQAGEV